MFPYSAMYFCHSQRSPLRHSESSSCVILIASEESRAPSTEILRFTQNDTPRLLRMTRIS